MKEEAGDKDHIFTALELIRDILEQYPTWGYQLSYFFFNLNKLIFPFLWKEKFIIIEQKMHLKKKELAILPTLFSVNLDALNII